MKYVETNKYVQIQRDAERYSEHVEMHMQIIETNMY